MFEKCLSVAALFPFYRTRHKCRMIIPFLWSLRIVHSFLPKWPYSMPVLWSDDRLKSLYGSIAYYSKYSSYSSNSLVALLRTLLKYSIQHRTLCRSTFFITGQLSVPKGMSKKEIFASFFPLSTYFMSAKHFLYFC